MTPGPLSRSRFFARLHLTVGLFLLIVPLLLLPLSGITAEEPEPKPSTLQQVQSIALPPRNVADLARRLDGVAFIPNPPTAPVQKWQVGDVTSFWADNLSEDTQFELTAELAYVTDSAYIWVEEGSTIDQQNLISAADTFADHTYPTVHATFGAERTPGIDGDPRLHILHASNLGGGTAAYFAGQSMHPEQAVPTSNAREMFFVNLDAMADSIGTDYYNGVLAHEFQHMVHWNHDPNEDSWLDEGLAELSALLTGYDRQGFAPRFLSNPTIQLNTWPEDASTLPHYGASFMFATYFYERFGEQAVRQLVNTAENGFQGIDATLQHIAAVDPQTGQPVTHQDLFADWTVANLLNDRSLADGRFGYTLLEPSLSNAAVTNRVTNAPTTLTENAPQYSAHSIAMAFATPGEYRVDFSGAETVQLVPVEANSGQYMWYSNRGDNSDSTLTHAFDLRAVDQATLEFMTWFDIEHLWDYGYLMVSTDNGTTWTILETGNTTAHDPHQNAYGPGFTGDSSTTPGEWIKEQVDLTPFAGQEILLRFEMITDLAVNAPGMVIDDIAIPEINYSDNFEGGLGDWQADGWLYIDNTLPQEWIVQAVHRQGKAVTVQRLLMPGDDPTGSWDFAITSPLDSLTLVISPVAPMTTEQGSFTVDVAPVP